MSEAITTVIVSRGMVPMLNACLRALHRARTFQRDGGDDRLVVVDNASGVPYSPADFGEYDVEGIRFDTAHSFAAACNAGMRHAPNSFYLMLNNDVFLHPKSISAMLAMFRAEPTAGIVGARLVYPNDTIQHAGMKFGPPGSWPYHVHRGRPSAQVSRSETEFQAVTGACLLIRHEVISDTGGFDEAYPFAWEDMDLCLRARQKGWRVMCCQEVDSIHLESMTPGRWERDPPARDLFEKRWAGKWAADG